MSDKKFEISEAIKFGWDTMKSNLGFFTGLLIVAFLIQATPNMVGDFVSAQFPVISSILYLTGSILSIVVSLGLLKVSINFCDGIKGKLDDLLASFNLVIKYLAASILYAVIVLAGLLLLIVPGVIWGIKYSLFPYFIADKGLGPVAAIKASAKATQGAKWQLFLFGLLLGLINFAGALALLVGLFVTVPVSMVAYAHVYRQLANKDIADNKAKTESPANLKGVMYINLES